MHSTLMKPVVVPPEILALKNAKLPEKLLLAIYAADPATTRMLRAMSMTRSGLRKLEHRLAAKGLLTRRGARHMPQVPGLVYRDDPEGGHFIPESEAIKTEQKVAPLDPTTTRPDGCIVISAEILDLKRVGASEKFLLTVYAATPGAQNALVLRLLGISLAGLKKLKRRLIQSGLLTPTDAGNTIQVPGMIYLENPDGGHFISESEAIKSGQIVAPTLKKVTAAMVIWDELLRLTKQFMAEGDGCALALHAVTEHAIRQVEAESPEGPERDWVLYYMRHNENVFFAYAFTFAHLPKRHWTECKERIATATADQLAAFREKAEGLKLDGIPTQKLIGMFSGAAAPQHEIQPQPGAKVANKEYAAAGEDDGTTVALIEKESCALIRCLPVGDFSHARTHLGRLRELWSRLAPKALELRKQAEGQLDLYDTSIRAVEAGWKHFAMQPLYERSRLINRFIAAKPGRLAAIRQQTEAAKARGAPVDLSRLLEG